MPSNLSTSLGALRQYLLSPPTLDDPKSLLRKARPPKPTRKRQYSFDFSDDEFNNPPKVQRKRKTVETQIYKSAAFIDDSDDDEVADRAFFAREKTLREEMMAFAENNGGTMLGAGTKRKREKKGKGEKGGNTNGKGRRQASERSRGKKRDKGASSSEEEEDVEMGRSDGGRGGEESEADEEVERSDSEAQSPVKRRDRSPDGSEGEGGVDALRATQRQKGRRVIADDSDDE